MKESKKIVLCAENPNKSFRAAIRKALKEGIEIPEIKVKEIPQIDIKESDLKYKER